MSGHKLSELPDFEGKALALEVQQLGAGLNIIGDREMKLELTSMGSYCATETFVINDVQAYSSDFGSQTDEDPGNAADYCCADMTFTPTKPTDEVLKKYDISVPEYNLIAELLAEMLSFGSCESCGWCE